MDTKPFAILQQLKKPPISAFEIARTLDEMLRIMKVGKDVLNARNAPRTLEKRYVYALWSIVYSLMNVSTTFEPGSLLEESLEAFLFTELSTINLGKTTT